MPATTPARRARARRTGAAAGSDFVGFAVANRLDLQSLQGESARSRDFYSWVISQTPYESTRRIGAVVPISAAALP